MGFDLYRIALLLLIVGGLNWGSVGLLGKDLVKMCCGGGMLTKTIYVAVGLSAVLVGLKMFGFMEGFENNNNMNHMNSAANMNMNAAANNMQVAAANMNAAANNMNKNTEGFAGCMGGRC